MRSAGRTLARADLRDGKSSLGMDRPSFCSKERRVRDDHRSSTMVLEDSRRPIALNECIRDANPGYLEELLTPNSLQQRHGNSIILPECPSQHGAEFLVLQRVRLCVGHTVSIGKTFKPQKIRKRHIGKALKK
jgi:hypothetical protein